MATKKTLWIAVSAVCLLALAGGGGVSYYWLTHQHYVRPGPLAPDADEAPLAQPGGGGNMANLPKCNWPKDFKLDMNIKLDVPEVPEKIKGPAAEESGDKN